MAVEHNIVNAEPRPIGEFTVGPIAYGQWRFTNDDLAAAQGLVEAALDAGMNLIDTADVYGLDYGGHGFGDVEDRLGKVLAAAPGLRDRMVLATKGGIRPPVPYDSGPLALEEACNDSLRRLGVDVIDLYQIHRPDLLTHPADVAATLQRLHDAGKIRSVGVSNHTVAQTRALQAHLDLPLLATQPEFSALHLDPLRDGTFDLAMETSMTPLAWSPLAGGRLVTGDDAPADLMAAIDRIAEREGTDRSGVAIAFVLAHPSRPVCIIGTQNPDRIAAAAAAVDVRLDRNDVYDLIQASEGVPLP